MEPVLFYISAGAAIIATFMVISRHHPIHALLWLVVSFLAVATIFLSLGAPFVAALEVILYAGAIIVLLIFVVMMLNLGGETAQQEKEWLKPRIWIGPAVIIGILFAELMVLLLRSDAAAMDVPAVPTKQVSIALFGKYVIAVELAGFLLMAGIVGAAHIGKHKKKHLHRYLVDADKPERTRDRVQADSDHAMTGEAR